METISDNVILVPSDMEDILKNNRVWLEMVMAFRKSEIEYMEPIYDALSAFGLETFLTR